MENKMEKIKEILSKLNLKSYIGIGIGGIGIYFLTTMLFSNIFSSSKGIDLIPKNTGAAGVISIGDIIYKTGVKDLMKLDLNIVEEFLEKSEEKKEELIDEVDNDIFSDIMENPTDIGLDIFQDFFVFGVIEDLKKSEVYLCVSGGIDDSDRLLEILEELEEKLPGKLFDIDEEEDYNIAIKKGNNEVVAFAWDDDKFLFISNPDKYRWDKKDIKNLKKEVERLFNLESDEKLTSVSSFNSFYDNKTDLCAWASAEGMEADLLDNIVEGIDKQAGFDLNAEDLQECSAELFYNFGDGNVSVKAALHASDGIQELLEEKSNISTSEFSFESTFKFDESGDNTIHVVLRSLLTIVDEIGGDLDDLSDLKRMIRKLERQF